MARFSIGQVVKLKVLNRDLGIILAECKEPENHWCVALRTKVANRTRIIRIAEKELEPYKRHCWNCDNNDLNSDVDTTCPRCGWVICPKCKKCEKEKCGSNGLIVSQKTGYRLFTSEVTRYYED